jgi:exosortase/archaeosortase family protein
VTFVALFIGLNVAIVTVMPLSFQYGLIVLTGNLASAFAQPFADASFAGTLLTIDGFAMEIVSECTALQFLTIFVAAVISYPGKSIRARVIGALAGPAALFVLNAVRITFLGLVGAHAPGLFTFLHIYLWQGSFVLFVVAAWVVWVRDLMAVMPLLKNSASVLSLSALFVVLLGAFRGVYLQALAILAQPVISLALGSAGSGLKVAGLSIVLFHGSTIYAEQAVANNLFDQLIFLALMMASIGRGSVRLLALRTVVGLGLLFLVYLAEVVIVLLAQAGGFAGGQMDTLYWVMRGVSVGSSVGLALWFYRKGRIDQS